MLDGKRVLFIGGSSGMGLASAKLAAERGADVYIASRSMARLEKARREIGRCTIIPLDATDERTMRAVFQELGSLDHLVTSAAELSGMGAFASMTVEAARSAFDSKFWSQYLAARCAAQVLAKDGSITFFSGVAAHRPMPGYAAVAAINGAVEALTRSLAVELAPVRVNAVCPGTVDTPAYAGMPENERRRMFDDLARKLPARRAGKAEDLAEAVLFCMENGFLTGGVLIVDGGQRLV